MTALAAGQAGSELSEARVPPHDLDAESAVLSAHFLAENLSVQLEPVHFYSDANRLIFEAIRATPADERPDIVTVANYLRAAGTMQRIGGAPYLGRIIDATPAVANVAAHAAIVRECARRRWLIRALQVVTAELYGGLAADEAWTLVREECTK